MKKLTEIAFHEILVGVEAVTVADHEKDIIVLANGRNGIRVSSKCVSKLTKK